MLDTELLNELQYHLVEPPDNGATWPSGLWTRDEVLDSLNSAQHAFLKDTVAILKRTLIPTTANTHRQALPTDWIATQRVAWWGQEDPDSLVVNSLARADGWETDHGLHSWPYATETRPLFYMDAELPTLQLQIGPAPFDQGQLDLLYAYLSATLTGAGIAFTVPDDFVPAVKWKTLATLLGKAGRGYDGTRAAYAQQRYELAVEAVRLLLQGGA